MDDLIKEWLYSENEIESIKIDGLEGVTSNDEFRLDTEIFIRYHSFD